MFSIQAHQARVHQRLILAPSHDPTRLARLAQNPYKVMCSKCAVTSFSRNAQHFLIAVHTYTYPSQRHARTSRTLPRYPPMTTHTTCALCTVHNIHTIPCTQNMHLCHFLETRSIPLNPRCTCTWRTYLASLVRRFPLLASPMVSILRFALKTRIYIAF